MKIYLACGLTHVPRDEFEAYCALIHKVAGALDGLFETNGVKYALIDSDPQLAKKDPVDKARLCYLWDRTMVEEADLIIAEASYPSIGMGIELQIAEQSDIPIVLCFDKNEKHRAPAAKYTNPDMSEHELQLGEGYVSLMALGLPSVVRCIGYRDLDDCIDQISDVVRTLSRL